MRQNNMDQEEIKQILKDLYAIDKTLQKNEAKVVSAIKFFNNKTEKKADAGFATELKSKLLSEIGKKNNKKNNSYNYFKPVFLSGATLAIAGLVIFVAVNQFKGGLLDSSFSQVAITKVKDNAFGTLALNSVDNSGNNIARQESEPILNNILMFPTPTSTSIDSSAVATAKGVSDNNVSAPSTSSFMPSYNPVVYKYAYRGLNFSQNEAKMEVLKKNTAPLPSNTSFQQSFGIANLKSFAGTSVGNVNLIQNQPFGYIINIDFTNGTININENYDQWPNINKFDNTNASNQNSLPDEEIVEIASQFLKDHSISTKNYGEPQIIKNNYYYTQYGAESKAIILPMPDLKYYSDSAQVLYPLTINNKKVYNSEGSPVGLSVNVNLRYKKVSNVFGLNTQKYEASLYDVVQDVDKILSMVNDNSSKYLRGNGNVIEIGLDTPFLGYVQIYKTENNVLDQFLVPALIFPIIKDANNSGGNIVVPLIADFFQTNNSKIMPPLPTEIKDETNAVRLPTGYTLEEYKIAEVLDVSCTLDGDCTTPGKYLMMSSCPYTSVCLKNKCTVVCPTYKK